MNQALAAINGLPAAEHAGRTLHEVLGEPPGQLLAVLHSVLESGEPVLDLEGDAFGQHFLFSAYPVRGLNGEVTGVACLIANLTRQRAAEAALEDRERQLELALQAGQLGTWRWELPSERITWSRTLEELHGMPPGTFGGTPSAFRAVLHPDDESRVLAALDRTRRGDEYQLEYRIIRRDGEIRWIGARGELLRDADGAPLALSGVATDVTGRKLAEHEREFHLRIGQALGDALNVQRALDAVVKLAVPDVADLAIVELYENNDCIVALSCEHVRPERLHLLEEFARRTRSAPVAQRALQSLAPVHLELTSDDTLHQVTEAANAPLLRRLEPTSWLSVPLVTRGRALGLLSLAMTTRLRQFTSHRQAMAQELARRAAGALDKAMLYQTQRQARHAAELAGTRLRQLQRATAALSHATTPEDVVRVLARHAGAATAARHSLVMLLQANGTYAMLDEGAGLSHEQLRGLTEGDAPVARAAENRTPTLIGSAQEWRELFPDSVAMMDELRVRALAAFPLLAGDEVRGVLILGFEHEQQFEEDIRILLLALAREAAGSLDRALLFASERSARARAESADLAKAEFLATMSHELRTPLSAILGYTSLLTDQVPGPLNERQQRQLGRVDASARHLLALIEEILGFGRLEAGREEPWHQSLELSSITAEAIALVEPVAMTQGLELTFELPDELHAFSDARMVRQILLNLLGNAIRYTPRGRIHVQLLQDGHDAVWEVTDTGIGIAPEFHDRIFTPFFQIDQSHTRRYGGTGLGLSLSRKLARLLGGDVTVRSAPEQGSVFTVRIPLRGVTPASGRGEDSIRTRQDDDAA